PLQIGSSAAPMVSPKASRVVPVPSSHMMPRSVPSTLNRSTVSLGLEGPVTCSTGVVAALTEGSAPVWPLSQGTECPTPPEDPTLPLPVTPVLPRAQPIDPSEPLPRLPSAEPVLARLDRLPPPLMDSVALPRTVVRLPTLPRLQSGS